MSQASRVSRRSFLAAAGAAAMTMAAGVALADAPAGGPEGGAPAGGPMSAAPATPPYSGEDDVTRVDENGDTVYYSMRRNWVGEAPVVAESDITEAIDADVVVLGLNYSGSQCFRMACEKGLTVVGVDTQAKDGFNSYGGQLGHFNSQWQREVLGVETEFDPWDFIDSYQLQSAGRAQPDLIKNFAKRNGELVDWMMELQPTSLLLQVTTLCSLTASTTTRRATSGRTRPLSISVRASSRLPARSARPLWTRASRQAPTRRPCTTPLPLCS